MLGSRRRKSLCLSYTSPELYASVVVVQLEHLLCGRQQLDRETLAMFHSTLSYPVGWCVCVDARSGGNGLRCSVFVGCVSKNRPDMV